MKKKALIFGISGQDGAILSDRLLKHNYEVYGLSRKKNYKNLSKLNIKNKINLNLVKNNDEKNILKILNKNFDEIYFLGGQSSVVDSFNFVEETYESQIFAVKIILNYIFSQKVKKSKFLYAASSEMFGQKKKSVRIKEDDEKNPLSPYGLAKLIAYEIIKEFRITHKLPVCSAILFNHESSLRPKNYVLKKIILSVKQIKLKKIKKLNIGNINIKRDWGWSEDYMRACNLILSKNKIDDYIIATGKTTSLKKIIELVFKSNGMDWKKFTKLNKKFYRKFEIKENYANIYKIKKSIGWIPKNFYYDIISKI
jgi:GDPmannose 4,6-dehydratase